MQSIVHAAASDSMLREGPCTYSPMGHSILNYYVSFIKYWKRQLMHFPFGTTLLEQWLDGSEKTTVANH